MSEGKDLLNVAQFYIDQAQVTFLQKLKTKAWYSGRKVIRNIPRWLPQQVSNLVPAPVVKDLLQLAVERSVDKICSISREGKLVRYRQAAALDGNSLENLRKLAKFEGKTLKDLGERIDRNMVKLKDATELAERATAELKKAQNFDPELMADAAYKLTNKARYVKKMLLIVETNKDTLNVISEYLDKMHENCTEEQEVFIAAVDKAYVEVMQADAPPQIPARPGGPPQIPARPGGPPQIPARPGGPPQIPARPGGPPQIPARPGGPPQIPPRPGIVGKKPL